MSVIKDALPLIIPVLTELINRLLLTSVFPSAWKESVVTTILEEGDHEVANNRPVSLLPDLSKIRKRAALKQLTEYIKGQNCLTEHQNGNKKKHSTETIHIFMSDMILKAMDQKQVSVGSVGLLTASSMGSYKVNFENWVCLYRPFNGQESAVEEAVWPSG